MAGIRREYPAHEREFKAGDYARAIHGRHELSDRLAERGDGPILLRLLGHQPDNSLTPLATNLDGTPPENSYTDTTHARKQ